MGYIYGTITITKENLYLEKKIYKFSDKLNLPQPKLDRQEDGGIVYIYNIEDMHEYDFGKLLCKVVYWKAIRKRKEMALMNEVEGILNG